ncbi:MAG: DUF4870 domain-containing protein [Oscillospiraceae bacterium]
MNDETQYFNPADINDNKGLCILSYFGFLFLIPMLVNGQKSPFTRFHVNQGMVLFLLYIAMGIVTAILRFIPILGGLISGLAWVGLLVLSIMGIVNAAQGTAKRLPIIGEINLYK